MRFASIVEDLGTSFFSSLITLIVFLPILWNLSQHITELPILGTVPPVGQWPEGCRFAPRCNRADAQCRTRPALERHGRTDARCWHPLEDNA